MKKLYALITGSALFIASSTQLVAQCSGGRYAQKIFPGAPAVTSDVQYGSNTKYDGSNQILYLDVYEPQCDVATNRPLIIIAHGGAFAIGSKTDPSYVALCVGFAQLGYVVASIEYRLGFLQDQYGFNGAIMRGVHDGRAAVRFMRDNALNGPNTWKIDPTKIYFGGPSAGGIMALHLAYQNQQSELTMNCGGSPGAEENSIEGTSNTLAASSTVNAILVISGGIRDLSWIQTNDIPAYLAHGTVDGTVPYGSGSFGGFFPIEGCSTIAPKCNQTGTTYCFNPLYGQDHVLSNFAYVDTLSVVMAQFLYHFTCNVALNCTYSGMPPALVPSVSIAITSGTNPTCQGTGVTFTATAVNPGPVTPVYQWQVNGINAGTNSTTFSSTTLSDADVVTCSINSICNNPTTASSSAITMVVKPTGSPTIAIAITSGTNPNCGGASLTFTATPTNGGASPTYQWKLNGNNVGTNSITYTSTTIANGDVVTCDISIPPASTCASQTTATSAGITMAVGTVVAPSISIAITSGTNPTCAGLSITFTATITNGGTNPVYQWQVNFINVGTNTNTYTSATPANNDVVTCSVTSNAVCATPTLANSNSITITIAPPSLSPTISIAITFGSNPTCGGSPISFTSTATNGGSSPVYQWKVNGTNVGTNSLSYTSTTLANADVVTCTITTGAICAGTSTATSQGITMTINPSAAPVVNIAVTSGSNQVCEGDSTNAVFTATASNAGAGPVYQWFLNGSPITGAQNSTYTLPVLVDGDAITCKVTSNAACASPATITSTAVIITVTPTASLNFIADMNVCGGNIGATNFSSTPSGATYSWVNSNTAIGLAGSGTGNVPAFTAVNSTSAAITGTVTVTPSLNGCVGTPSTYSVTVNPTATITQNGNVLTSSASSTYQWYLDGQPIIGATNQTCTIAGAGNYSVVVAGNVCPSEIITVTGIGDPEAPDFFFSIYPNPNNGNFSIAFDIITKADYKVELRNTLGALVYQELLTDFNGTYSKQLDVTEYGKGIYMISLTNSKNKAVKKVLVY